jgi:hypothetical protein
LFIVVGIIGFLFALGIGVYVIKNAQDLSVSTYRASGEAFGPKFWLWAYRITGIWAIGFSGFILYVIINSIFSS